eukprot:CAMPEP_0176020058 /NCGR_PEP_ID=MMETSP0120_2-20121206/9706_1 /TAXON_ID=160619 /ORGANISM="Kryptoperidinium foliaceum, Strain CCMP 1326" /LENGTH=572 /DNA_ID=CAMNT_0017353145 /DNA_START=13 /DNA_END=1727 /DNA_ORIENTATION=-
MGRPKEMRCVMVGLDAAGKTTILYKMKLGEVVTTMPTIGFNVETISIDGQQLTIWDLGLRSKARPLVKHYLTPEPPGGLIFVVDSNDRDRLEDAADFLRHCLDCCDGQGRLPRLLIFANKTDLPGACSPREVFHAMGLERFVRMGLEVEVFGCAATLGSGLAQGFDWLCGLTPTQRREAPVAEAPPEAPPEAPAADQTASLDPPEDDDEFLAAFEAGANSPSGLRRFDVEEFLRVAFLHRARVPGASARATFEAARRRGYVEHATRAWFWIALVYRLPLHGASTSMGFLETSAALLPRERSKQEELISRSFSTAALDSRAAAAWGRASVDCSAAADAGAESDENFVRRVEALELEAEEMHSSAELARLAFVLLRACPKRRDAIRRMDVALRAMAEGWTPPSAGADGGKVARLFHETRQYVTLHLVHAAIATRPDLSCFAELSAACPEVCEASHILQYYSEAALAKGEKEFVPPDLQPLPSVVQVPQLTWHDNLDDGQFLEAMSAKRLSALGTPSLMRCAYLFLREGRRAGMERLLGEVAGQRGRAGAGNFAHETLAFFCMHMVHFYVASIGW